MLTLAPGCDGASVKLRDDEAIIQKTALLIAGREVWPAALSSRHDISAHYIAKARDVLTMIDDVQGQRVYKVAMRKPDDAATLRSIFDFDPGLGPQLRDFDDESGVFDVLNEHYRNQRN